MEGASRTPVRDLESAQVASLLPWGRVVTMAVKDRGWAVIYGNKMGSSVTLAEGRSQVYERRA